MRIHRGCSIVVALGVLVGAADAKTLELHPPVPLLDADGTPVITSGRPISTMRSCAGCHDTHYIAGHSYHANAGRNEQFAAGTRPGQHAWDYSTGAFGGWSPLLYRYLTPPGDNQLDLGTAEWIQTFGWRHVGGGPAVLGHGKTRLEGNAEKPDAAASTINPDAQVLDAVTGQPKPWDWQASGVVEMNCFLCHTAHPDNAARIESLRDGHFGWANTATLAGTKVVARADGVAGAKGGWQYNPKFFLPDGSVSAESIGLQEPESRHCGQCHGQTHYGETPLALVPSILAWSTATKGQVFSPQRMFDSAINLSDKEHLSRPWDVHAAAMLDCTGCHFSLNDPKAYESSKRGRPAHLRYEPRRLAIGEFLCRPSHQFAKGHTTQGTVARHLDGTMRRCDDCHNASATHDWLPHHDVHFARLSCEACHIAETKAPALRQVDWTLLGPDGEPRGEWRGIDGGPTDPAATVTGFRPVLLPKQDLDGATRLVPHNLVTSWYWVEGGPTPRPVRLVDLTHALLESEDYHPDIRTALDTNDDGTVDPEEAVLNTPEKIVAVKTRLAAVGVNDPHIASEISAFGLHHGVGPAGTATKDCEACHATDSRLARPFMLASYQVGDALPQLIDQRVTQLRGQMTIGDNGRLVYQPSTTAAGLYVLGHNRWAWVDWLGGATLLGVMLGVVVHTGMRIRVHWSSQRKTVQAKEGISSDVSDNASTNETPGD